MNRCSRFPLTSAVAAALFGFVVSAQAVPTFSTAGFVEEQIHAGNGMISMDFDHLGNLLVTEKQGRVLLLKQNTGAVAPSFSYKYYEGTWNALPNFSTLTPVSSGTVSAINIEPRLRDDNFALTFTGVLELPSAGTYTFYAKSDDGSRIMVDDAIVVDHDGPHGSTEKSGTVSLSAGSHTLRVEYFEAGGGESLEVSYAGPDLPKQVIGSNSGPYLPPVVFADIVSQVNTDGERGLLGFTLDPAYATNRYFYLLFSTNSDQRIVRYTANEMFTAVVPGSEHLLISGFPNSNNVHKAGDMGFRPGEPNHLHVMLGDDGNRNLVSNLDLYNGKLLRIDSATGLGLADNPQYDGNTASVRSRIWAHRFRNPFRFAFDPENNAGDTKLYISENGDGTDRILRILKGADGGWDNQFLTDSSDQKRKILYSTDPSLTAIAFMRGGPFAPDGPVIYNARYGGDDRKEIRRWRVTGANLDTLTALPEDNGGAFFTGYSSNIVSFAQGPDGALYFTDSNQGSSTGTGYRLGRIRYIGGTGPVAAFTTSPQPARGVAPLSVQFTDSSTSTGASIAQWAWSFGDGLTSTAESPSHTFNSAGVFNVSLTVTDTAGLNHTATSSVTVVHRMNLTLDASIVDARASGVPVPLSVATDVRFYQIDGITPLPFPGGTGEAGNILAVPAGGVIQSTVSVELTGPGVVVSAGESISDGVAVAFSGFPLSLSSAAQSIQPIFRLAPTLIRGRAADTLGNPARVDVGLARGAAASPYAVAGGRDFLPASGLPATGVEHRMVADGLGYFHFPLRTGDGGSDFTLDTAADTLAGSHGKVRITFPVPEGAGSVRDLTIGLYDGATGVDDLSTIAATPAVDFETQIQTIFTTQCAACHNDIATNSGGLDLEAGDSLAELLDKFSVEAPGVKLVDPGYPERSYLMEKISSASPQVGTRMRPGDPMSLPLQALIRDWITQLGSSHPYDAWKKNVFGVNAANPDAAPSADYDGDGVSNLFSYAFGTSPLAHTPRNVLPVQEISEAGGERYLSLRVTRDPVATGLVYSIEATNNLSDPSSWSPVTTVTMTNTPSLLVVRDALPYASEARRFLRLRVSIARQP